MPEFPPEFQTWRSRFHRLLREAVEATPLRFDYDTDDRTLFMTYRPGSFDIRAVLSATQKQGVVCVRRRTELVVPTDQPHTVAERVKSILSAAGSPEYPVSNPGERQHVQHTGEFPLTWEEMRENEHLSLGWYLYHIIHLHDLFCSRLSDNTWEVMPRGKSLSSRHS